MSMTGLVISITGVEKNLREMSDRTIRAAGLKVFDSIVAMLTALTVPPVRLTDYVFLVIAAW